MTNHFEGMPMNNGKLSTPRVEIRQRMINQRLSGVQYLVCTVWYKKEVHRIASLDCQILRNRCQLYLKRKPILRIITNYLLIGCQKEQ